MAFVNEYVSDKDKAQFDWANMPNPWLENSRGIRPPSFWTVDHERNVFLIATGHGREEDADKYRFLFWWNGKPQALHMRQEVTSKAIIWHLDYCPPEFRERYDDTATALREALHAYGTGGSPKTESTLGQFDVQCSF